MKKIIFSIATIAILMFSGCNDFLVKDPILDSSASITLSNYDGLNKATMGAYSRLTSSIWYGGAFVLDAEMRSGNGKINLEYSSGRYTTSYNMNYSPSVTTNLWGVAYYVISAANNVINNVEGKEGGDVTIQSLNNLKAECLFLRALSHFDLVRTYAQSCISQPNSLGVPYVKVTDATAKPARNTVKEVFDNIVVDLLEAESIIASNYVRTGVTDPKSTVTKPAIQALLSRVYLYMGEWQKAADYATTVINNSAYKMWTADQIEDVWVIDIPGEGEVIFEVYGLQGNSYDPYWDNTMWQTSPDGYADCAASNDLVNLYSNDDVRGELFVSPPDDQGLFWTTKYAGKGKGRPDVNNTIILRLSEMYLNRAEAIVRGATVAGVTAVADMNVITSNRNAAAYTSAGMEDIYLERRKELAWEGHLWFDLSRMGRSLVRNDYTGTDASSQNLDYPSYKWALPIPKRETDINGNLVPNPGYN